MVKIAGRTADLLVVDNPVEEAEEAKNTLTVALIVKDEEKRIKDVIPLFMEFADQLVVLDDGSTDKTQEYFTKMAENDPRIHYHRNEESIFWDAENDLREQLWQEILPLYDHDWIMALDMDEEVDPRFLEVKDLMLGQSMINGFTFQFWEFWGDREHVRVDRAWNPGQKQMPILVRWLPQVNYQWSTFALHGGRIPLNQPEPIIPSGLYVKHYGWSLTESQIRRKYKRYMERDPNPHPVMLQHYQSMVYGNRTLIEWYLD